MLTLFLICALLGGGGLWPLLGGYAGDRLAAAPTGRWLDVPGIVSFAAFFGLGGLLASWLGQAPAAQVLFALLAGSAVGGFTAFVLRLARQRGEMTASLVGRTGQVLVSPQGERPGSVKLMAPGRGEQRPAQSTDALHPGDRVLIVGEAGGWLDVRRWDGQ